MAKLITRTACSCHIVRSEELSLYLIPLHPLHLRGINVAGGKVFIEIHCLCLLFIVQMAHKRVPLLVVQVVLMEEQRGGGVVEGGKGELKETGETGTGPLAIANNHTNVVIMIKAFHELLLY